VASAIAANNLASRYYLCDSLFAHPCRRPSNDMGWVGSHRAKWPTNGVWLKKTKNPTAKTNISRWFRRGRAPGQDTALTSTVAAIKKIRFKKRQSKPKNVPVVLASKRVSTTLLDQRKVRQTSYPLCRWAFHSPTVIRHNAFWVSTHPNRRKYSIEGTISRSSLQRVPMRIISRWLRTRSHRGRPTLNQNRLRVRVRNKI